MDDDDKFKGPRPWRRKGPKDGESDERVTKGGHKFKWNPTGNEGTGIWEYVKPNGKKSSDNNADNESSSASSTTTSETDVDSSTNKKPKKTVTFNESTKDATSISVNKSKLLSNLASLDDSQKAFISQFVPKE